MSKIEIKDKLDKILYQTYNVLSEIIFYLKTVPKNYFRNNLKYKDIHFGERCFILGTGPSLNGLTAQQINILKDELIFGTNSLYKADVTSSIVPKYYALLDNLYWEQLSHTFNDVVEKYKDSPPVFITDQRARHLAEQSNPGIDSIVIHSKKYPIDKMSDELHGNIFAAMNVVSYAILTASYMGFKKIFLLGCDYNAFCTSGRGHAYNDTSELSQTKYNLAFYLRFYWLTTEFHYLIDKLARSKGVEIVNITPGSLLDAYRHAHIDDVLIARN